MWLEVLKVRKNLEPVVIALEMVELVYFQTASWKIHLVPVTVGQAQSEPERTQFG